MKDIRGKQSAAILIVNGEATGNMMKDKIMDLRVEDNENPLQELERLIKMKNAYNLLDKGDQAMEIGDTKAAEDLYMEAQQMIPENLEMQYWYAINLLNNKEFEKANPILESIFKKDNNWKTLTSRLIKSKLLNISDEELQKVMKL